MPALASGSRIRPKCDKLSFRLVHLTMPNVQRLSQLPTGTHATVVRVQPASSHTDAHALERLANWGLSRRTSPAAAAWSWRAGAALRW